MMILREFTRHRPAFEFQYCLPRDVRPTCNVHGRNPPICLPAPDGYMATADPPAPRADSLDFRNLFSFNQFHVVSLSPLSTGRRARQNGENNRQTDVRVAQTGTLPSQKSLRIGGLKGAASPKESLLTIRALELNVLLGAVFTMTMADALWDDAGFC